MASLQHELSLRKTLRDSYVIFTHKLSSLQERKLSLTFVRQRKDKYYYELDTLLKEEEIDSYMFDFCNTMLDWNDISKSLQKGGVKVCGNDTGLIMHRALQQYRKIKQMNKQNSPH